MPDEVVLGDILVVQYETKTNEFVGGQFLAKRELGVVVEVGKSFRNYWGGCYYTFYPFKYYNRWNKEIADYSVGCETPLIIFTPDPL